MGYVNGGVRDKEEKREREREREKDSQLLPTTSPTMKASAIKEAKISFIFAFLAVLSTTLT